MKSPSITTRILGFVVGAFALASLIIVSIAHLEMIKAADSSQHEIYEEKISNIISALRTCFLFITSF